MSQSLTDKLLIHAARTDNVQLFTSVTMAEPRVPYDINFADGIGNTALHYACAQASVQVIDALLDEEVDVDVRNRLEGNTPLHEACRVEHEEARNWIVSELLSAGADPRIRNAAGLTPDATVVGQRAQTPLGRELINMLTSGQGMAALGADDIADDDGGTYSFSLLIQTTLPKAKHRSNRWSHSWPCGSDTLMHPRQHSRSPLGYSGPCIGYRACAAWWQDRSRLHRQTGPRARLLH